MKRNISVITVDLNGKTRFVKVGDKRTDGRHIMEYTDNAEDATEYENDDEAQKFLGFLHNPFERELGTDTVTINVKPIVPQMSGSFK